MSAPKRSAETSTPTVGVLANPMSGRDVRRVAARASTTTQEIKRDQVARAVIGAVAAGARRILVVAEPLRIASSAVEHLEIGAEIEVLDVGARLAADDTLRGARALRDAGCGALIVLGGDGTNRIVARAWPDAPVVALSTGTNNVFPRSVEATLGGAAAGLVASGRLPLDLVARRAKCVRVEIPGEPDELALIDAVLLVDDRPGNYMPIDPERIRRVVLARAEPASVGASAIGGLVEPAGEDDDFGVEVVCGPHASGGRAVRVPISPGLYRTVHILASRRLPLGARVRVPGPGVLAFDGDRERSLAGGAEATLTVARDGPRVIDVERALRLAGERGLFEGGEPWRDAYDGAIASLDCCGGHPVPTPSSAPPEERRPGQPTPSGHRTTSRNRI